MAAALGAPYLEVVLRAGVEVEGALVQVHLKEQVGLLALSPTEGRAFSSQSDSTSLLYNDRITG